MIHQFNAAQHRRGVMQSSINRREADLRKFERWLAPGVLTDATVADLEAFIDCRSWDDRTRYCFISHLHAFYSWAVRHGLCQVDPTEFIERPKLRPGLPRPIDTDDLKYLITQAAPTMRAWLYLGAFAGLRCAEIGGLHRADIVEADDYMRVLGKGRKPRIVPLHPLVLEALRLSGMPRTGSLWGEPLTGTKVSCQGNRFIRACGVDATMHQLRHWFGTHMYRATHDILATGGVMGHASSATTQGYAAFDPSVARTAVLALSLG